MDSRWMETRNILLVRLDNLGDVLLCTPAFHAIKATRPEARLTLLASPIGAQAARLNPDLDDVIVYQAPWMDVWGHMLQDSRREQEVIDSLREREFDAAIIFTSFRQSSLPPAYLCYLADIPLRLAISLDGAGSLLTTRHKQVEDSTLHEVRRALNLVAVEGFHTSETDLVLRVPPGIISSMASRLLLDGLLPEKRMVVVHPGCSMPARTYPWDMFARAADLLAESENCQVVFTGDVKEVELVQRVRGQMVNPSLSLAGQASFPEFAALLALADTVVTNNTGPAHMAAALKTPVVDLFALTNPPEQWRPWNVPHRLLNKPVPCALCYSRVCPTDHGCLRGVEPEEVAAATRELLDIDTGGWRDA